MNTSLREINLIEAHAEAPAQPVPILRAVEKDRSPVVLKAAPAPAAEPEKPPAPAASRRRRTGAGRAAAPVVPVKAQAAAAVEPPPPEPAQPEADLGVGGLRLAFCLCGFRNALTERQRRGEQLSEREALLLTMSAKDLAAIRPLVTGLTLGRLDTIVSAPGLGESGSAGAMEVFALSTLRTLSERARHLLATAGPDAALSLFGDAATMSDPLAIFEMVFSASLDIVEAFERMIPGEARLLSQLAELLDSEIEKV